MSDRAFAKQLCGLKGYFKTVKDKGRWNPLYPRVEIKTAEMATGERTIMGEFFTDYLKDITINAKKLLAIHPPKTEAWSKMNESVRPHLIDAQMWVMKEMVRLSCKYEERGDYGLEGYFRSCFNNPWERLGWRSFIENVDSNVPTWIKDRSELHIIIYRILRKAKKWNQDEIFVIAEELQKDYLEVSDAFYEVINLCLKHGSGETAKILKDQALAYDESDTVNDDNDRSQVKAVLKESIKNRIHNDGTKALSDQEIVFLLGEIRKPIGELINDLNPSEWKLLDFNYDESFKTNRLIDLDNEIYNKIKTDLKIDQENDIYNRLKTITKKVIRNFKEEYSDIVEAYNLTDSAIKSIIEDYYFCTRDLDN